MCEMGKGRMEAFSDGVIAIIITIMVLELKVPHGASLASLLSLWPVFVSYVLSFVLVGIYWNNHHHLLHASRLINGKVLWANLLLLFCLSLIPFATAWMGENEFATLPVAVYGAVQWISGLAYYILARNLIAVEGRDSALALAVGRDKKGLLSLLIYTIAIPVAFISAWLALALYVVVAVIWFIPDRRIEQRIARSG